MKPKVLMSIPVAVACVAFAGCGATAAPTSATAAASGAAAKPASAPASTAAPVAIKMAAGVSTPSSMFVYLADDKGLYKQNGLDMNVMTMSGQAQMQALVAGEAQAVLHVGADLVFTTETQGTDMKIVFTGSKVDDDLLVAGNDITAVEQLKGKKVGAQSVTSVNGQTARRLLAKYGLQEGKDYTTVVTGSTGSTPGLLAALLSHQVDAACLPLAIVRPALKQGQIHTLVDVATRTDIPVGSQVLVLPTSFVQQRPDVTQKVVDSLMQAVRMLHQDKAAAQAELKTRFKISDQAELDEEYDREVQVLAKVPLPAKEDFAEIVSAMPKDVKPLTDAQFDSMVEPRFVNDAVNRGLTNY